MYPSTFPQRTSSPRPGATLLQALETKRISDKDMNSIYKALYDLSDTKSLIASLSDESIQDYLPGSISLTTSEIELIRHSIIDAVNILESVQKEAKNLKDDIKSDFMEKKDLTKAPEKMGRLKSYSNNRNV